MPSSGITPGQRARIAKWCGWTYDLPMMALTHEPTGRILYSGDPEYSSLNDCLEFQAEALKRGLFADYADALETVVDTNNVPERMTFREYAFLTATAEQRATAILRVIEQQEGQGASA